MKTPPSNHITDQRGGSRLAEYGVTRITDLVKALHGEIARVPGAIGGPRVGGAVEGITALVYDSIRSVTRAVGGGIDRALGAVAPALGQIESSPLREALLSALNGVLGDYLAASGNPLVIPMCLRRHGQPLVPTREVLAAAYPAPSGHLLLLVHGLCMNDLGWRRKGHDHGAVLAHEIHASRIDLLYNSGLHVSTNGHSMAQLLEALEAAWPVPVQEITILAHSMGGLVARSAHHAAQCEGLVWAAKLRRMVFLGTPHHGAPLERGGHWIDLLLEQTPFTAPFARLGKIRSAGITDLRQGLVRDEEWQGRDRFAGRALPRRGLPLPADVQCFAVAATSGTPDDPVRHTLLGDGLVPVPSALGEHRNPRLALSFLPQHRWIAHGCNHLDLLSSAEVCQRLRAWLVAET
jgi:pimeloyl-ACP methyl ester carboxylesterase